MDGGMCMFVWNVFSAVHGTHCHSHFGRPGMLLGSSSSSNNSLSKTTTENKNSNSNSNSRQRKVRPQQQQTATAIAGNRLTSQERQ